MSVWRLGEDGRVFIDGEEFVPESRQRGRARHASPLAFDYPSGIPGVIIHQEIDPEMFFNDRESP